MLQTWTHRRLPFRSAALLLSVTLMLLSVAAARADQERVTHANFQQAQKFSAEALRPFVYDSSVFPNWIGKTDSFWYAFRSSKGTNYYRVNCAQAVREPLFDQIKLGTLLGELIQKPLDPAQLPLTRVSINDEGSKLKFVVDDFQYEYDLAAQKLAKLGKAPPQTGPMGPGGGRGQFGRRGRFFQDDNQRLDTQDGRGRGAGRGGNLNRDYRNFSPDRKVYVYAQKHNLYLVEGDKEKEAVQLTKDGAEDYSFGGSNEDRKVRPFLTWSADGKAFYITRPDSRGVKELYLVNALATPRPALEKYKYPMPGEDAIRKSELYVFNRAAKKLTRIPQKWRDEGYTDITWGKTSDELRFIHRDRLRRHLEVCAINPNTLECKCLISEGFENANIAFQTVEYLKDTDEMIWWSERSGWGHFYLYDRNGTLKNAITAGLFRAGRVVSLDTKNRQLYFTGNGREAGENVYFQHLYCVHLDGTGLTLMDPGNATHLSTLSPSRQFVVDNCSRVDMAPVSLVRDATGRTVMELEKADLSRLAEFGWKMPETFVVKAADGMTDLYGNMWKPFDFDPKKKYPIIAHVYPGPQQEGVTHNFSAVSGNQQLAQLGFIVIQVGHRGGTPTRSKAYHSYGYFNLRDYGLADKKAAIEQLAARHPFIDIERVGIYGHSGGGFMSAAAMLQKPYNDFFKAAVASSGNHDNNIYNDNWAEQYHGLREIVVKKDETKKEGQATTSGNSANRGDDKTSGDQTDTLNQQSDDDDMDVPEDAAKTAALKKEAGKQNVTSTEKKEEKKAATTQKQAAGSIEKKEAVKDGSAQKQDVKSTDKKEDKKDAKTEDKTKTQTETKFEIHVPTNAELAANLKGHLLLVHGDMDNNVHPANTMRLVDALIKANKRFDMLIIPGKRHGYADYQPYFTQRMFDFFVEHLMGERLTNADILEKAERK
ncbi:MAG TPA: DPP IV N-terminal domain-containing protein [Gemmataceae bacterium]|jgi:dipeptidyl aminopeptidase/acylaminoacyl peptidase|nr:DPP IV N-terminal domain-containing protein [Gemmataceae bacterium]